MDSHGSEVISEAMSCEGVAGQQGQDLLNTEAEESTLLGAVTQQWLVKTS
jgi:hypothetical protein